MRVLHIYKDYYPVTGGMENHIRALAEEQARRGFDVSVLVTSLTKETGVTEMNGVRLMRAGRLATIASTPLSIELPRLLFREHPDIAHLHFPYPVGELSQLFFGKATKVVLTYHSDVVRQKRILRFYKPFLKRVLAMADRIIATSDRYVQSSPYLGSVAGKCRVIPLGIDPAPFLNFDSVRVGEIRKTYRSPLLLFVGKLRYYKGLHYLLEAMREIDARLLVAGTGPMEAEWKRIAAGPGIAGKVTFLGEVEDDELPPLYHACDVFVLPASERSEAFGLVQVEAMMCGKPVVSTELGTGTSFVNMHDETGFVVPARDAKSLGETVRKLLTDKELRLKMGEAARARALQEFTLTAMADRTIGLYRELFA